MSYNDKVTDEGLLKFEKEIFNAAEMLQISTLSLRSLYVVNSSSVDSFVKLRQKITNNAKIYSEKVLPTSDELIQAIQRFYDLYKYNNLNVFKKYFDDFAEEAKKGAEKCNLTLKLHNDILVEFENNEDEVIEVLEQLKLKTKEYERKKNKLLKSADVKLNWAIGLALVPVVNLIAGPILFMKGSESIGNAIAESEEELLTIAAAEAIKGPLITSIINLVNAFQYIAEFFKALTDEFNNINDDDDLKMWHFNRMRANSVNITKACRHYLSKVPASVANLRAIPDNYDKNYVEKWLSERS